MKRILLLLALFAFTVVSAPPAEAWQVNVKNSCKHDVKILVGANICIGGVSYIECTVGIKSGATGTCVPPENKCPVKLIGEYQTEISSYRTQEVYCSPFKEACFWNVNAEVVNYGANSCLLELR